MQWRMRAGLIALSLIWRRRGRGSCSLTSDRKRHKQTILHASTRSAGTCFLCMMHFRSEATVMRILSSAAVLPVYQSGIQSH